MRLPTFLVALVLGASPAFADGAADERCERADSQPIQVKVVHRGGETIHVIEGDIVVCGQRPRPSVAYVAVAKTINYEWETLAQDLLPAVLASVKKAPF